MALFGFENALGWLALFSLLPFILIYLIKPKPKELDMPSLMFFTKSLFSEKERSFLRRFTSDWIFFLQLLALLALSFFFISPYVNLEKGVFLDNVVIVLDTSASMQANHDRAFNDALAKARELVGKRNTFILISSHPRIGVENADSEQTLQFMKGLKSTDTRSNIGDAILLAGEYAKGDKPIVYIVSDFISTEGVDVDVAVNALKTKGITVNLIDVNDEKKKHNVGIVDVKEGEETTQVLVKNFNNEREKVTLSANDLEKDLTIGPNSVETFSFKTPNGVTELKIDAKDDLAADNEAFVSKPNNNNIKVLLVTNDPSLYLNAALSASKEISVTVSKPPIIPDDGYDVYVVNNVDKKLLITGIFEKVKEQVEQGAGAVIYAQDDSNSIDYKGLLPFAFGKKNNYGVPVIEQRNRFTRDVEFGNLNAYFTTLKNEGSMIVSADNSSIVSLQKLSNGRVAYYGVLESASDFKLSPSYPVFWVNLVKFLADVGEMNELNVPTGTVLTFEKDMHIKTPSREITNDIITLDEIGVYTIGDKVYAANLNSEAESDINGAMKGKEFREKIKGLETKTGIKYDLSVILIIVAAILLLLETLVVKLRGDI